MRELLKFSNAPNKSFFGLDKGSSHSFTIPVNVKEQLIDEFCLEGSNLQKKVVLIIEGLEYYADIRMGRILNIRPHRIKDRSVGYVLKLQWAKYPRTRIVMSDFFSEAKKIVLQGEKNVTNIANFNYLNDGRFEVSKFMK